jgi:hypothetical protein
MWFRFSKFSSKIAYFYEKYPLLANSLAGGTVYFCGEVVVQFKFKYDDLVNESITTASVNANHAKSSPTKLSSLLYDSSIFKSTLATIDWSRASYLGSLGAVENGFVMLYWYSLLVRVVGAGTSTMIVLTKCFLDQIFYATQQDATFLAACVLYHSNELPLVIDEVSKNLLTIWINDCSIWPLVNFVGFAFVPYKIQPTFMSIVQFFWQIYISSVVANSQGEQPLSVDGSVQLSISHSDSSTVSSTAPAAATLLPVAEESPSISSTVIPSTIVNSIAEKAKAPTSTTVTTPTVVNNSTTKKPSLQIDSTAMEIVSMYDDQLLEQWFHHIDQDKSGYIDDHELYHAFNHRGIQVSKEDIDLLMLDIDHMVRKASNKFMHHDHDYNSDSFVRKPVISLDAFKYLIREHHMIPSNATTPTTPNTTTKAPELKKESKRKSSKLLHKFAKRLKEPPSATPLDKGAKNVLRRFEDMKERSLHRQQSSSSSSSSGSSSSSDVVVLERIEVTAVNESNQQENEVSQWKRDRENALLNAQVGGTLLFFAAAIRRVFFKI